MKITSVLYFASFAAGAVVERDVFEEPDFNVTAALLDNGFNVAAVPELASLSVRKRSFISPCAVACKSLDIVYGSSKLLRQGSADYEAFQAAYWSAQQAAVSPYCVFKPTSALDVSSMVLVSRLTQCPFAVKGGSHAAFPGASSIEGGITLSMENFTQIKVAADKKTVDIGPGNRWATTYQTLEKDGLAVVGGRMAPVGVPGLMLGGGISFFGNKRGWACDNVASYEVVTASGAIVTASPTSFPDLYWALRGGGNNFGVVTNFKLEAFQLGKMWGGQRIYTQNNFAALKDAIFWFGNEGSATDTDAAQIVVSFLPHSRRLNPILTFSWSFAAVPGIGNVAIAQIHYAQPIANASIFDKFNAIQAVADSTGVRYLSELAILMNEGSIDTGLQQTMWDVTFKLDRDLFDFMTTTFFSLLPSVADIEDIFPVISIQAITSGQLAGMQKKGGNALGLQASKGPFFVMNMSAKWKKGSDSARAFKFFSDVIKTIKTYAKEKGLDNEYVYLNYASQFQDAIGSYGAANVQRLQAVSRKYDPEQVFQKLQPGGFKLSGGAPDKTVL